MFEHVHYLLIVRQQIGVEIASSTSGLLEEPIGGKLELFELVVILLSEERLGVDTVSSSDFLSTIFPSEDNFLSDLNQN